MHALCRRVKVDGHIGVHRLAERHHDLVGES